MHCLSIRLSFLCFILQSFCILAWTPIVVKKVTVLGPQLALDVTSVSRDGGYSTLIDGHIVWLYDDTECHDLQGKQLSFVSNTAAYQHAAHNVTTVDDFGVVDLGSNADGSSKSAILAGTTVGKGGWIPFQSDELDFNEQMLGKERVAIWPGTSPTSISTTTAFLYAPLVYVDYKPQDPTKEYQARGMTLIAIGAQTSGPVATRQGDLIIPGTDVPYGGFSSLVGSKPTDAATDSDEEDRDVYLLGMTDAGLQLARVGIHELNNFSKYTFWNPDTQTFASKPPKLTLKDPSKIYIPGSFSSGSVFYSPYFETFIMVYFNKMVDSTFYVRSLQLDKPLGQDQPWMSGGKGGKGIVAEDVEALIKYEWSSEQKLYASEPAKGGFNYAGNAHPEYFNTQFFPKSLYQKGTNAEKQKNDWYGSSVIAEQNGGGDGKNLLLSWTSQTTGGGFDNGIYQIELAVLQFDDISHSQSDNPSPTTTQTSATSSTTPTSSHKRPHIPISSLFAIVEKGTAVNAKDLYSNHAWCYLLILLPLFVFGSWRHWS